MELPNWKFQPANHLQTLQSKGYRQVSSRSASDSGGRSGRLEEQTSAILNNFLVNVRDSNFERLINVVHNRIMDLA